MSIDPVTGVIDLATSTPNTYTITYSFGTAPCNGTTTSQVTVSASPTATVTASGPLTFCTGGSVTLTASAGTSWLWSNGETTQVITVNMAGSYSVTVTNATACSATSAATVVTVNPLPTAIITADGPPNIL